MIAAHIETASRNFRRMVSFASAWNFVLFAQGLGIIGQLVFLKLAALVFSAADFSNFVMVQAIASSIHIFIFGPFGASAIRFYQEAKRSGLLHHYYRSIIQLSVTIIALVALSYGLFRTSGLVTLLPVTHLQTDLGVALGLCTGFSVLLMSISSSALMKRTSGFFSIVQSWSPPVGFLAAKASGINGFSELMTAAVLGALLSVAVGVALTYRVERVSSDHWQADTSGAGDPRYPPQFIRYAIPLVLWGPASYLSSFSDRWVMAHYSTPDTLGALAAMNVVTASLLNAVMTIMSRVVTPVAFAASADSRESGARVVRISVVMIGLFGLAGALSFAFVGKPVLTLVSSAVYAEHARVLWLVMIAHTLNACAQQSLTRSYLTSHHGRFIWTRYVHALATGALLLLLVPRFQLEGAAVALFLAHGINLAIVVRVNRRLYSRAW